MAKTEGEKLNFSIFRELLKKKKIDFSNLNFLEVDNRVRISFIAREIIDNQYIIFIIKEYAKERGLKEVADDFNIKGVSGCIQYKNSTKDCNDDIILATFTNDSGSSKGEVFIEFLWY